MPAPDSILQLVENFELHRRAYLSHDYNETHVRREFIDHQIDELVYERMMGEENRSTIAVIEPALRFDMHSRWLKPPACMHNKKGDHRSS